MNKLTLILSLLATLLSTSAIGKIPYHSKAAHKSAIEFAPGIISTDDQFEINTVFNRTGTQVIFARCEKDFSRCTMLQSNFSDGKWQAAQALPFAVNTLEADAYYNEDYSELYFISKRPIPGDSEPSTTLNFWKVAAKADGGWGEPEYLPDLSSDADDLYPSLTDNGDLYFPSFRNDKRLLYVAKKTKDGFAQPEPISAEVYGEGAKIGDSAVSRDGRFIIFSISGREDSQGKGDLYVSHKSDQGWSTAKSLGPEVNSADHEFTPIMSPDGEYLFFTRIENGLGKLYQVHKSLLDW